MRLLFLNSDRGEAEGRRQKAEGGKSNKVKRSTPGKRALMAPFLQRFFNRPGSKSPDNFLLSSAFCRLPSLFILYFLPFTFYLLFGLSGCSSPNPETPKPTNSPSAAKKGTSSTFFGGVLEEFDEAGRPVWRVQAQKAKYTVESKRGQVENPYGELYQDGKVVYQIKADNAEIEGNAQKLFLKGKIIAVDPKNGVQLRGNELEWRPKEDLLIVRNQLNGNHKQLQAVAQEARVKTRQQTVEFIGGVVANSKEPPLQMRTEQLLWQLKEEKLIASRPIQMFRYAANNQITDRGSGDSAEINLKTKVATVTKNTRIELIEPPIQITSNTASWDLKTDVVTTNTPVRVFHRTENLTVTANQSKLEIPQKTVYLTGNVYSVGQRQQSLRSERLTWFLDKKLIEATDNVIYQQVDPPLTFKGDKATGNIETQNISVTGGNSGRRVVTEIIPPQPRQ
jgi:LPS export ABC transporter protein LptC